MNTNIQIDKIDKVLSKISGKEMKCFVGLLLTREEFAERWQHQHYPTMDLQAEELLPLIKPSRMLKILKKKIF